MMKTFCPLGCIAFAFLGAAALAPASTLTVMTSGNEFSSAAATGSSEGSKSVAGKITKDRIVFDKLLPGEHYDLTLTNAAAEITRLVDLSWYSDAAADPKAAPLDDEDRAAIKAILTDIKTFTNKNQIVTLVGTGERAVGLVELIRDTDFHANKGGEIIWRMEVWYFENQAGGWAKVQQQNRLIERVRFESSEAMEKYRKSIKWIGLPWGLKMERGKDATITLPKSKG
jgi:hypothetical protein